MAAIVNGFLAATAFLCCYKRRTLNRAWQQAMPNEIQYGSYNCLKKISKQKQGVPLQCLLKKII